MSRHVAALAILALAAAGAGCGRGSDGDDAAPGPLVVSAAASLQRPLTDCARRFGDVRLSFAGSDELAAQIRQGVKPDVFAAANTALPTALAEEGLVAPPRVFATNELVLAVPAESPIRSVDDVTAPELAIAIGAEGVPVGDYTREVLTRLGPRTRDAILGNVRSNEPDVRGIVGKLTQIAVEAGFVYLSDVRASDGQLRAIRLPERVLPDVAYGAAPVTEAPQPALGARFVDGLVRGDCQRALREAGFGPPPSSP